MGFNKKVDEILKKLEKISDRSSKEAAALRKQLRDEGYSLRAKGKKQEKAVEKKSAVKKEKVSKKSGSSKKTVKEVDDDDDEDKDDI